MIAAGDVFVGCGCSEGLRVSMSSIQLCYGCAEPIENNLFISDQPLFCLFSA